MLKSMAGADDLAEAVRGESLANIVKSFGFKSAAEFSELTGVSAQTLGNQKKEKTKTFIVLLIGAIVINDLKSGGG